jgi:hypothetical protein
VLQGDSVVEGWPLEGELRGKGTCWGLNDLVSRLSQITVRAQTHVHVLSLSRLDFISGKADAMFVFVGLSCERIHLFLILSWPYCSSFNVHWVSIRAQILYLESEAC